MRKINGYQEHHQKKKKSKSKERERIEMEAEKCRTEKPCQEFIKRKKILYWHCTKWNEQQKTGADNLFW